MVELRVVMRAQKKVAKMAALKVLRMAEKRVEWKVAL